MRYHPQGTSLLFSGSCVNAEMSRSIQPLQFPLVKLALPMVLLKTFSWGTWVGQLVKHLPLAQVMIWRSWDRAPRWVPCSMRSLLLPLPLLVCSLSNEWNLKKKKKKDTFMLNYNDLLLCYTSIKKSEHLKSKELVTSQFETLEPGQKCRYSVTIEWISKWCSLCFPTGTI